MFALFFQNPRVIGFGIACTFLAGLGQTYLLAQFIPYLQEDFGLSRTQISANYSLATLTTAFLMTKMGSFLDHWSLRRFGLLTATGLTLGYLSLAFSQGVLSLFLAFLLIRAFGQMNFGLMGSTTLSRLFGQHRGKAITLSHFGRALGEGFLPILVASMIAFWSWQTASLGIVFIIITLCGLAYFVLIRGVDYSTPRFEESATSKKMQERISSETVFDLKTLWKEKRALVLMFTGSFLPFAVTGLFFLQASIASAKGVALTVMASSFVAFSIVQFSGNLIWGPLVDRLSSRRVLPFGMVALTISLMSLVFLDGALAIFSYMIFLALSIGITAMSRNSFWADAYGPKQLGKLKGMDGMMMVLGTSVSSVFFAFLLDNGLSLEWLTFFLGLMAMANGLILWRLMFLYGHDDGQE
jgi:MFS family permease